MTNEPTDGTPPEDAVSDAAPTEGAAPALEQELEDLRQKYLRAVADYQNLRRRSDEERKEWSRYTLTSVIVNYLPVLDDLDRALSSVDADIAEHRWVEGVRMVERKFRTVLESSGVQPIEAEGAMFDPAMHEAISYAPGPEGSVVAVVQAGYTVDGRVIRPARVVVGSGQPAPDAPAQ
ncbi:MAG: nucleotide exchange factor GrpE [Dehalococcoidia bacterium]